MKQKKKQGKVFMAQCNRCRLECDEAELRDVLEQRLCEDCYIDNVELSKTCDPWAVHSAKIWSPHRDCG